MKCVNRWQDGHKKKMKSGVETSATFRPCAENFHHQKGSKWTPSNCRSNLKVMVKITVLSWISKRIITEKVAGRSLSLKKKDLQLKEVRPVLQGSSQIRINNQIWTCDDCWKIRFNPYQNPRSLLCLNRELIVSKRERNILLAFWEKIPLPAKAFSWEMKERRAAVERRRLVTAENRVPQNGESNLAIEREQSIAENSCLLPSLRELSRRIRGRWKENGKQSWMADLTSSSFPYIFFFTYQKKLMVIVVLSCI